MRVLICQIVYILVLSSCSPSLDEGQTGELTQEKKEAAGATTASGNEVDTAPKSLSPETPYLATFKKALEPVPNFMADGILSVADGCIILTTSGEKTSAYTPVFPKDAKIISKNGVPIEILFEQQRLPFGVKTRVPGGAIGTNHSLYLAGSLPASCPRTLFGVGG